MSRGLSKCGSIRNRRVSLFRVMIWIGALAVVLAVPRKPAVVFELVPAVLGFVYVTFEGALLLWQLATGQDTGATRWLRVPRRIVTAEPLWVVADGFPLRVELITSLRRDRSLVEAFEVVERVIDGRLHLCTSVTGGAVPLDLIDHGPVLADHERYGLCLVQPLLPEGEPS